MNEFLVVKLLYIGYNNDNCHLEEPMLSSIYLPISKWAFGIFYAYIHYKRLILIEAFIVQLKCCGDDFRMMRDNEIGGGHWLVRLPANWDYITHRKKSYIHIKIKTHQIKCYKEYLIRFTFVARMRSKCGPNYKIYQMFASRPGSDKWGHYRN